MKDSSGHIYSVPLYSTIEIGMVQHCTTAAADRGGKNTLLKTTKVSDIMALKVYLFARIYAAMCWRVCSESLL